MDTRGDEFSIIELYLIRSALTGYALTKNRLYLEAVERGDKRAMHRMEEDYNTLKNLRTRFYPWSEVPYT
jgi:hypothetical protein